MIKLYTLLGDCEFPMEDELFYFCGSYMVVIPTKTDQEKISMLLNGRVLTKEEMIKNVPTLRKNGDYTSNMTIEEIVDDLEDIGLLISGEGGTAEEAMLHIFEKCSFVLKFPVPRKAPRQLIYARLPKLLPREEKWIYDLLSEHWKKIKDLPKETIHGSEYQNYYVTIDFIMKSLREKGLKPIEILETLIKLYRRQVITLYWKKPKYEILPGGNYHAFYPAE